MPVPAETSIVRLDAPFRVALFVLPGFSMMALSAAVEPLRSVNRLLGERRYEWVLVGRDPGPVAASNGFELTAAYGVADSPEADLTVVVASLDIEGYRDRAVFAWLRRLNARRRRLGAISNGTIVLARAGLLAGRRATVHWESRQALAEEFPDMEVSSDLYCLERDVMSAAGGLAAMDMMLALIASRDGRDVAADVSEQFLRGPARPPTAMQRQDVRWRYQITDRRLATAIRTMENRLTPPLQSAEIADAAGISERQLERLFAAKFGTSPARFYLDLRLKAAKDWLLNSTEGLEAIAARTGFSSVPHFSRSFKAWSGQSPSAIRQPGTILVDEVQESGGNL